MTTIPVGSLVKFKAVFRDGNNRIIDPSAVILAVTARGVTQTYHVRSGVEKEGAGVYTHQRVCDSTGPLVVIFTASTGQRAEVKYEVVPVDYDAEPAEERTSATTHDGFSRADAVRRLEQAGISCVGRTDAWIRGALGGLAPSPREAYLARMRRRS